MSILQQVIIISSLLSFPITFVSMCIVDQHQKDVVVSSLIILFWILPPLTLYIGLHISKKYRNRDGHGISLGVFFRDWGWGNWGIQFSVTYSFT